MWFWSQYLAVVPYDELVTCISRLVPRYILPADCFFSPPSPPLCFWSARPMFSSFMSLFVYIHGWWLQDDAAGDKAVPSFSLSFPSPFFFPSLKGRLSGMLGVSKLASVSGVPGEQPCRNSWAEWAVRRKGGKVSSVLWGFPNPNSPCKDLLWTTFGQPVFTPAYKPSSVGWRTHF